MGAMLLLEDSIGYERNVYYHPEIHGLERVSEVDYSDGCYQFDLRVVWKDSKGRLWTARDSGCSCPSPFEDTTELERLFAWKAMDDEYIAEPYRKPDEASWRRFRDEVKAALRALRGKSTEASS
jgi:hypothetical protein